MQRPEFPYPPLQALAAVANPPIYDHHRALHVAQDRSALLALLEAELAATAQANPTAILPAVPKALLCCASASRPPRSQLPSGSDHTHHLLSPLLLPHGDPSPPEPASHLAAHQLVSSRRPPSRPPPRHSASLRLPSRGPARYQKQPRRPRRLPQFRPLFNPCRKLPKDGPSRSDSGVMSVFQNALRRPEESWTYVASGLVQTDRWGDLRSRAKLRPIVAGFLAQRVIASVVWSFKRSVDDPPNEEESLPVGKCELLQ